MPCIWLIGIRVESQPAGLGTSAELVEIINILAVTFILFACFKQLVFELIWFRNGGINGLWSDRGGPLQAGTGRGGPTGSGPMWMRDGIFAASRRWMGRLLKTASPFFRHPVIVVVEFTRLP